MEGRRRAALDGIVRASSYRGNDRECTAGKGNLHMIFEDMQWSVRKFRMRENWLIADVVASLYR